MTDTSSLTMDTAAAVDSEHPDTTGQQALGFWLYLMSDLALFAALFATYVVLARNTAGGPGPKDLFDLPYAFVETMLLLFSSAAYGMAMPAMDQNRRNRVTLWLVITFVLGAGFIAMEVGEFHHLISGGHTPAHSAFLSAYFTLVGTHGMHVSAGLIWMVVMLVQIAARGLTAAVQSRLIRLSMFWHFLDIVWVGVFTIVYLSGVIK